MKTKVIIIGEAEAVKPELKKIEFVKRLDRSFNIKEFYIKPDLWLNIELVVKNYSQGFDLMFAYDNIRQYGVLFIGHFNDGVV